MMRPLVIASLVTLLQCSAAGAAAQAVPPIDTSALGPQVGATAPEFTGTDQFGRHHTLASALGDKGAMIVFFRSADW
jgi:hypothetical protein